jgi:hypothetical protein
MLQENGISASNATYIRSGALQLRADAYVSFRFRIRKLQDDVLIEWTLIIEMGVDTIKEWKTQTGRMTSMSMKATHISWPKPWRKTSVFEVLSTKAATALFLCD